jgi:hypothetical protein
MPIYRASLDYSRPKHIPLPVENTWEQILLPLYGWSTGRPYSSLAFLQLENNLPSIDKSLEESLKSCANTSQTIPLQRHVYNRDGPKT